MTGVTPNPVLAVGDEVWLRARGWWRRGRVVRLLPVNVEVAYCVPSRPGVLFTKRAKSTSPWVRHASFNPETDAFAGDRVKYFDPPSDREIRLHLGVVIEPPQR